MKKSVLLKNGICVLECNEGDKDVCCDCNDYNSCHFVSRDKRGIMIAVIFSLMLYLIVLVGVIYKIHDKVN
ncbi:MAG: hypothetical protein ACOYN6_03810 [Ignavibacteria bacterium]